MLGVGPHWTLTCPVRRMMTSVLVSRLINCGSGKDNRLYRTPDSIRSYSLIHHLGIDSWWPGDHTGLVPATFFSPLFLWDLNA